MTKTLKDQAIIIAKEFSDLMMLPEFQCLEADSVIKIADILRRCNEGNEKFLKNRIKELKNKCPENCEIKYRDCDVSQHWDCDESILIKELQQLLGDDK